MKSAAIYARVSTADQVKGTSLDGQVALCQEYAKEHGYSVLKVMQEDASGARLDRPKLSELRNMAERHEIDVLLVSEQDRLSRSNVHTFILCDEFERLHVDLVFVKEPRDTSPEGKVLFGFKSLFKEWEREKITDRMRNGRRARINRGQVMSSRACGYGYEYLPAEKRLQVLESEAVWVRKMYEWAVLEGCSLRQIALRLDQNGVPTKKGAKAWHPGTVSEILNNEINAGTWSYGKHAVTEARNPRPGTKPGQKNGKENKPRSEWRSVSVPAIVSQELYDAVHAQLEHNRAVCPRNSKYQYLFRSLLTCARCGRKLQGHYLTGAQQGRYECPGRVARHVYGAMEKRCDQPSVSLERIETVVWDEVVRQLSDEKELRKKLEEREAELKKGRKDDEAELEILAYLEAGLKRQTNKDLDLYDSDIIDKETLRERMALTREKQAALARSKAEVIARLVQWEQAPTNEEAIKELVEIARDGLPDCTFAERRRFLEGMAVQLKLDGNKVTVKGLITDSTLTLADKRAVRSDVMNDNMFRRPALRRDLLLSTLVARV